MIRFDRELRELNAKTAGAVIENHEKLEGGIRRVTYSNGVMVYVNYTDEDRTADGETIGAKSFRVSERTAGGEAQ